MRPVCRELPCMPGNGLIVNEKETVKLADKLGLFVMGIDPAEFIRQREK